MCPAGVIRPVRLRFVTEEKRKSIFINNRFYTKEQGFPK
jgi:hypothetical protein